MLLEISISNFALIEELKLNFSQGLNIMTGETGSGKSIIIDSVNFVLGERVSKDVIRTGAEQTYVEAVFQNVERPEFFALLNDLGIEPDQEVLVLSRELNLSGRSICRLNGKAVTTSALKSVGSMLIDIHGQHQHQSLLNESLHMDILDAFGGERLQSLRSEVSAAYADVRGIQNQLDSIMGDDRERERKLSLLNFQIDEIDGAKLSPDEEDKLLTQRRVLDNAGKIYSVLSTVHGMLYESGDMDLSAYDRIGKALSEMEQITGIDEKLRGIYGSIQESYYTLEGAVADIREYRDGIDFDPELLNRIEERLDLISRLKSKYGASIEEILRYRDNVEKEKEDILNSEKRISSLKKRLQGAEEVLRTMSESLSSLRRETANRLKGLIAGELKFLCMEKAEFAVDIEKKECDGRIVYGERGMDEVRFLISANPGEPLKPLSKIASGGELSRIMLAIKTSLADADRIPTLIFDEIDTGISGRAAQAVADKLNVISRTHQVICITHLPQIASYADTHFCISKSSTDNSTSTSVKPLDSKERISEIARMLGGKKLTELTIKHAEEMLRMAHENKR